MSTANANRLHQQWTHQLLCRSALLPRPSTLKLVSLPIASGAPLHLALGPHPPPPPPPTDNEVMLYRKRGSVIAREIIASRVQAPLVFCTEAKVAKGGGVFAGHYGNPSVFCGVGLNMSPLRLIMLTDHYRHHN